MQKLKNILACGVGLLLLYTAQAQPKILRVEYYVDTDPGYGKAKAVSITAGNNISNKKIDIKIDTLKAGLHIIGIRAKDSLGAWSLDNTWLFLKPDTASKPLPNLAQVEYYVDIDPGYGKAKAVSNISGNNISNRNINIKIDTLKAGLHIIGIRAKDSLGAWSLDNTWLFLKPDTIASNAPNITRIEYYIDKDPGYGNGIEVAIDQAKNYPNVNLFVNVSTLKTGKHKIALRSKDNNGSWSLDNVDSFTVSTVIPGPSITAASISSKIICAGGTVKVGYQKQPIFNTGNVFSVQISDSLGNFGAIPIEIGHKTDTASGVINCTIPPGLHGSNFKIRIKSTTPQLISANTIDSIKINGQPPKPTITPAGPLTTCNGKIVSLTASGGYTSYTWSNDFTTQQIKVTTTGKYSVVGIDSNSCSSPASDSVSVTFKPLPAKPVIKSNIPVTNVCPKDSVILTADSTSNGVTYKWNTGDTTKSITVKGDGNFIVTVSNASGCANKSDTTKVTYQGCGKPTTFAPTAITSTKEKISWSAVPCALGYQYEWRIKTTPPVPYTTNRQGGTATTLTGLLPGTTYQWRVIAGCKNNTGDTINSAPYSVGAEFTTLAAAIVTNNSTGAATANILKASLSPNPTTGNATVYISNTSEKVQLRVTDISGKVLWQSGQTVSRSITIPSQGFAAGTYIVMVKGEKESVTLKMVKE